MKIITTFIFTITIACILLVSFAYSGFYDVSARSPHSAFTNWLAPMAMHASVKRRSKEIAVPDLNDEALQIAGISDFDAMCKSCHGAPGYPAEAVGKGLNPPPPDLKESASAMTSAELFWVTKQGIKMTGMPAWGATHDDEDLWAVVAFMKELPNIDAVSYESMLLSAKGMGHHAGDNAGHHDTQTESHDESEHQLHDAADSTAEASGGAGTEHDHSTHKHGN
ncbi:MAG: cytochrome c [Proteobacteria bacterium]|nr:cytochrome c [Pseudomonadota bacterium]